MAIIILHCSHIHQTFDHFRRLAGGAASGGLDSEEAKALYVLGRSVGRQLGELNVFTGDELDSVRRRQEEILGH